MIKEKITKIAEKARLASRKLGNISTEIKNNALLKMADMLEKRANFLVDANEKDIEAAEKNGLPDAMIDRLTLNSTRISEMASGLRDIAALPDPVGEVDRMRTRPNGLRIGKFRAPIGVIGVIFESRPNVTSDAAGLCIKSGNAIILRGGSEAINSNIAIASLISGEGSNAGLPEGAIQLIDITDREAVMEMLKLDKYIDLIIPRGGYSLIRSVVENSIIPVVKHDKGICHVYIDKDSDHEKGLRIVLNAKTQRPGVCNALETLLVHKDISRSFLPVVIEKLREKNVEVRGCPATKRLVSDIADAVEQDWNTEYLDLILSIRVVDSLDEAIDHITQYGSMHSEAIVTDNYGTAWRFLREVDAAAVYVNASTRFTDGGQFGLGAEMGISTQKLHCRGPMGLDDLTSLKYIIMGDGQIRE